MNVYEIFRAGKEKMIKNALTTTTTSRVKLEHAKKFDMKLFSRVLLSQGSMYREKNCSRH